jgi:type III secretion protein U
VSDDKTEQPTDKKIEDARQKGQVPVSRDFARLIAVLVAAEMAFVSEPSWHGALDALLTSGSSRIGQPFRPAMLEMLGSAGLLLLVVFSVFFVVCSVVAVASYWGQFGILVSTEVLTPNLDKLNPVNGVKQIFTKKKLTELLLTMFKVSLIGWLVYRAVRGELPNIVQLAGGAPKDIFYGFFTMLRTVFHTVIALCIFLALIDLALQRHFHTKQLMMDMEEIKKEYKEMEGDPMVKGQRKQLAREWANSDPVQKTAEANAVVVNPTHFAVAMLFDQNVTPVPVVLAKGKDEVAQAMIRRAKECGIPVIRHVWLARTLYATCRPDTVVPKSSYEAVAYVYAVVLELIANNETRRTVELESHGEPPASFHG